MHPFLAAAFVGVSFGNSWLCAFLSLGTRGKSRTLGISFLAGRFLGLMVLGTVIALFGHFLNIPSTYYLLLFAILSILFGILILTRPYLPHWAKKLTGERLKRNLMKKAGAPCPGNGGGCGGHRPGDGSGCGKGKRKKEKQEERFSTRSDLMAGIGLGLLRGATPCVKMLVLIPLILAIGLPVSLGVVAVFALTSMLYPVIGLLLGEVVGNIAKLKVPIINESIMRVAASLILIGVGVYYLVKVFNSQCTVVI